MAGRRTLRRYDRMTVLDYIDTYQHERQRSPSQRRICKALNMSAPSVAHNAVHALERAQLLKISIVERGLPADLEITKAGRQRLEQWRQQRDRVVARGVA